MYNECRSKHSRLSLPRKVLLDCSKALKGLLKVAQAVRCIALGSNSHVQITDL